MQTIVVEFSDSMSSARARVWLSYLAVKTSQRELNIDRWHHPVAPLGSYIVSAPPGEAKCKHCKQTRARGREKTVAGTAIGLSHPDAALEPP